ncbi:MAG: mandelate racemase/muconate lactonizing enzyme family protein [Chloroflexi bacterium]|nr:mandelate racemase/muconate lactonizing enzyme family protein [Chloroflexota bacterium]
MKIKSIRITPNVMPKKDPTWRIALGAFPESRGLLVEIGTDTAHTGLGYVGLDSPYRGSSAPILRAAFEAFEPQLAGQDPLNLEKIISGLQAVPVDFPAAGEADMARARMRAISTIDMALHDILGKTLNVPVYQLLGGLVREEIPVIRIMALKEPAEMAEVALGLRNEGYKYIKIKLEGNMARDIQRIRRIRAAVGPEVHLTVDANQSYSAPGAIEAASQWQKYGIELVEQPVPADDIEGLTEVSRRAIIPVEAHESVDTPDRVFKLAKTDFAGYMNVSVILGGLRSLKTIVDVCKLAGVKCVISCVGTRILSAASMHFVASCSHIDFACQLGEFTRFNNDPAGGLEVQDGMLRVPTAPGLGVRLNAQ